MTDDDVIVTSTYSVAVPGCVYAPDEPDTLIHDDGYDVLSSVKKGSLILVLASGVENKHGFDESLCLVTTKCETQLVGWIKTERLILIEGVKYY